MEDKELQRLWLAYDKQIADARILNTQSWALNLRCFEELQQSKARRKLRALSRHNMFAVILGIVWILLLGLLVWGNHFQNPYFSGSVAIIALFNVYAVWAYLYHTVLIGKIDYDEDVVSTQKRLAVLQSSTFKSLRIIWLQLPFYSTFFWSTALVNSGAAFWLIAFPVTLTLTGLAIYLYRSLRVENMNKKWVRSLMMAGPELKNITRSMAFLKEVEEVKKGLI